MHNYQCSGPFFYTSINAIERASSLPIGCRWALSAPHLHEVEIFSQLFLLPWASCGSTPEAGLSLKCIAAFRLAAHVHWPCERTFKLAT